MVFGIKFHPPEVFEKNRKYFDTNNCSIFAKTPAFLGALAHVLPYTCTWVPQRPNNKDDTKVAGMTYMCWGSNFHPFLNHKEIFLHHACFVYIFSSHKHKVH